MLGILRWTFEMNPGPSIALNTWVDCAWTGAHHINISISGHFIFAVVKTVG